MENKKCKTEGCKRPYRAKGYCTVHYKKWRQGELPHRRYKICHQENCRKPMVKWGLCEEHYKATAGVKEGAPKQEAAPVADATPAA